jgi:hypothetical protein
MDPFELKKQIVPVLQSLVLFLDYARLTPRSSFALNSHIARALFLPTAELSEADAEPWKARGHPKNNNATIAAVAFAGTELLPQFYAA